MKNIIDYVRKNTEKFSAKPFNRTDALILSWASYFCYPECVKGEEGVTIEGVAGVKLPDEEMYAEAFLPQKSKKLFRVLTAGARFKDLRLSHYRQERDESLVKQFAAVCIELDRDEYFLSFRGTDPSFCGWKEDFNMACRFPVPFQQEALEYTQTLMKKYPRGKFYLGGHSKGGNAAVYAAMQLSGELQERVVTVYNFDGPGFLFHDDVEEGFESIKHKIVKIIPQASFVGMLFETSDHFCVIKSRTLSVLQHNPFSWYLAGDDFCPSKKRTKTSVKIESVINKWILELPLEERERFIEIIYNALNALNIRDFNVFFKTIHKQIPALYREYKRLSADDKRFFDGKIKRLVELFKEKEIKI